jgi:hypothetical protein
VRNGSHAIAKGQNGNSIGVFLIVVLATVAALPVESVFCLHEASILGYRRHDVILARPIPQGLPEPLGWVFQAICREVF